MTPAWSASSVNKLGRPFLDKRNDGILVIAMVENHDADAFALVRSQFRFTDSSSCVLRRQDALLAAC